MNRRAFSIIELIVVLGIIMILIGLVMPAVGAARGSATNLDRASSLRQIGLAGELYCSDWDDAYAVADVYVDIYPDYLNDRIDDITLGRAWPNALIDAGVIDSGTLVTLLDATPLNWSATMYVSPRLLRPDQIIPWEDLRTSSVRRSSARSPSRKGLLATSQVYRGSDEVIWALAQTVPAPIFAADGAIHQLTYRQLATPSPAPVLDYGVPITTTWHGIAGLDW